MRYSPDGHAFFVASLAVTTCLALVVSLYKATGARTMEKQGDEELVGLAASVAVPLSVAASGSPTIVTSDSNGGPSLGDETSVPGYDIRERSRDTGRDRGLDRSRDRRGDAPAYSQKRRSSLQGDGTGPDDPVETENCRTSGEIGGHEPRERCPDN